MENINLIVAKNICEYRKKAKLTQAELGEKLNFTDKSVSKWEKGEYLPEFSVLYKICEIFGITLNDLVNEKQTEYKPQKQNKHLLISLMSAGLVWLVATTVFVALLLFAPEVGRKWLCFIYAIPVSTLVLLVFSCIWGGTFLKFITSTILCWTILISVCLTIGGVYWYLLFIGIPVQVLIALWFYYIKK